MGLTICEALLPKAFGDLLPLGGSHLAQIGILFGVTFIICEWAEGLGKIGALLLRSLRKFRRTPDSGAGRAARMPEQLP